jgi:hypothetical protein
MTNRMSTEAKKELIEEMENKLAALENEVDAEEKMKDTLVDKVEDHLIEADLILQALLDVAEMGRKEMEAKVYDHGERFVVIHELLEKYRKDHSKFIEKLYLEKKAA